MLARLVLSLSELHWLQDLEQSTAPLDQARALTVLLESMLVQMRVALHSLPSEWQPDVTFAFQVS